MAMPDIGDLKVPRLPLLGSDRVVAVGHAGHVHLLDLDTGRTIWTRALAAEKGASACEGQPVSVGLVDEIVLAGSMGHVFALSCETGAVLWHAEHRARGSGETSLAAGSSSGDYVSDLGPIGAS
jgi:outer membrane protein assembly factor BamB